MAHGARLASAVMFVRDLDRSVSFYSELLTLSTADRSPTAALLVSEGGSHLILRAMGRSSVHPLGATGVQYVVWTMGSEEDLAQCERVLKEHSSYLGTHTAHGVTAVEGRDPDGIAVIVCYSGPDQLPPGELRLSSRIYAW